MQNLLDIKYKKIVLQNGLEVILYQDKNRPTVAVNIWYKVGSANEITGKTGLAHLFEHMMFQGSENIGKEEHFKYIQEAGGTLNGSTSMDRTNYYETLPANSLELALWLESDRMGFFLPALNQSKLDNQREVVMNERRQRYDNQPYGLSWEIIFSNLYPKNHPYHWPTIGWMKDIEKYTLEDVRNFFEKYYSPQNASLVIAGNFEEDETIELVKKYFEEITNKQKINEPIFPNYKIEQTKKIIHKDNVQLPRIYLTWKTSPLYSADDSTLDILSNVLSASKNSRLYKKLVFEKQIALDVFSFQYSGQYEGSFIIASTAKPGVDLEEIKNIIFEEINNLIENGIDEEELVVAKNAIRSDFIYSLQDISQMANQINNYNCTLGEPNSFEFDLDRYGDKTTAEVVNIAQKYLSKNYIELQIISRDENDK